MYTGHCFLSGPQLKNLEAKWLLTWNGHKIRFAHIAADTPGNDKAISTIVLTAIRKKSWQLYRLSIDKGGNPQLVEPAILFSKIKSYTKFRKPAALRFPIGAVASDV